MIAQEIWFSVYEKSEEDDLHDRSEALVIIAKDLGGADPLVISTQVALISRAINVIKKSASDAKYRKEIRDLEAKVDDLEYSLIKLN